MSAREKKALACSANISRAVFVHDIMSASEKGVQVCPASGEC